MASLTDRFGGVLRSRWARAAAPVVAVIVVSLLTGGLTTYTWILIAAVVGGSLIRDRGMTRPPRNAAEPPSIYGPPQG